MNKIKILLFTESLRSGGKERRIVELIKGLSGKPDIQMELVLTRRDIHYKDIFSTKIKIHYLTRENIKQKSLGFLRFYKIAKKFKPNIIHVWGYIPAIYAIPTKLFLKTIMINNEIANAPVNVSKSLVRQKLTFLFSDKIIANSNAGIKSYNAPKSKSDVIYNGFDFNRISKLENKDKVREKFNITTKFVVAMVASFSYKKDYETFVKAANLTLQDNPNITFLCVGNGNSNDIKSIVKKKNKSKILFLGGQSNVESIMNICDIGVLITNDEMHGEGIPNALLEFMALGKPVIANSCGGTKELVNDNVNGFLINSRNSKELKDRILLILNDSQIKNKFGNASKIIVIKKFNIEQMIYKFKKIYEEVV